MRKNFYALAFSLATAMVASASVPRLAAVQDGSHMLTRQDVPQKQEHVALQPLQKTPVINAVPGPGSDDKLITEIPEGETKTMVRYGLAYGFNMFTGLVSQVLDGSVHEITITDKGDVYLNYPVSFFFQSVNSYIKGTLSDDIITIQLPQLMNVEDQYDDNGNVTDTYYDYALKMEFKPFEQGGEDGWYYPAENQIYRFKLNEDGSLTSLDQDYMIGQCDWLESEETPGTFGWAWQGNGDFVDREQELTEKVLSVPEEASFTDWTLVNGYSCRTVPLAFLDDKVYIKNIFADNGAQGAIVGTLDGDKVTFASDQYLGVSDMDLHTTYFMGGHVQSETQEGETYDVFVNDGSLTFDYDKEKLVLHSDNGAFSIVSADKYVPYTTVNHPYIAIPNPNAKVRNLLPPVIDIFYPAEEDLEAEMLFTVPAVDKDMNVLDPEKYFYQLIMDDEVFTFYDDEYELPEGMTEMTEVPVNYTSDNAYDFYAYDTNKGMVIYPQGYEVLGIRTLYKGDVTVYSPITYVSGYESGIGAVHTSGAVASVCYFTLDGIRVSEPGRGMYIRMIRYEDGTVTHSKVIIRK